MVCLSVEASGAPFYVFLVSGSSELHQVVKNLRTAKEVSFFKGYGSLPVITRSKSDCRGLKSTLCIECNLKHFSRGTRG